MYNSFDTNLFNKAHLLNIRIPQTYIPICKKILENLIKYIIGKCIAKLDI